MSIQSEPSRFDDWGAVSASKSVVVATGEGLPDWAAPVAGCEGADAEVALLDEDLR